MGLLEDGDRGIVVGETGSWGWEKMFLNASILRM